ncbi:hypothetical protein JCM16303_005429 [Sporobolomyces ruberrimus]
MTSSMQQSRFFPIPSAVPWHLLAELLTKIASTHPHGGFSTLLGSFPFIRKLLELVWPIPLRTEDQEWLYRRAFDTLAQLKNAVKVTGPQWSGMMKQFPTVSTVLKMLEGLDCYIPKQVLEIVCQLVVEECRNAPNTLRRTADRVLRTGDTWKSLRKKQRCWQEWESLGHDEQFKVLAYMSKWAEAGYRARGDDRSTLMPSWKTCNELANKPRVEHSGQRQGPSEHIARPASPALRSSAIAQTSIPYSPLSRQAFPVPIPPAYVFTAGRNQAQALLHPHPNHMSDSRWTVPLLREEVSPNSYILHDQTTLQGYRDPHDPALPTSYPSTSSLSDLAGHPTDAFVYPQCFTNPQQQSYEQLPRGDAHGLPASWYQSPFASNSGYDAPRYFPNNGPGPHDFDEYSPSNKPL